MKVLAHYSSFMIVDIPDDFSEEEIMDYLSGMDVLCDKVDYEVLEEEVEE